jgi:hypothetical protein
VFISSLQYGDNWSPEETDIKKKGKEGRKEGRKEGKQEKK